MEIYQGLILKIRILLPVIIIKKLETMKRFFLLFVAVLTLSSFNNETDTPVYASYYSDKFNGRKTASGERFDNKKLTAAHKKLPFGTNVKVTNPKTGKSVIVRINDRGPFIKNRVLDLSKAAFEKLGDLKQGVMLVHYEIIKEEEKPAETEKIEENTETTIEQNNEEEN